ncbi:hypothetical protein SODALDRAFT_378466 [Sodiomyces alkalinus F11]|uniref:Uncharacterized protein n=1 Tax=Sodiomyces alkalinus (strain CBS 110278 / VKM F-3762 / F11) TaxID=1314773 RepID=A0A3N2PYD8_SODAK|nr:hypothetical protein SODALDRAFT_378466 [Sodiomyces alkalinus F11]ROT39365.1 hypothetical protein SODALDRAFT_378466 [Sodiomyces alkalinus F11]
MVDVYACEGVLFEDENKETPERRATHLPIQSSFYIDIWECVEATNHSYIHPPGTLSKVNTNQPDQGANETKKRDDGQSRDGVSDSGGEDNKRYGLYVSPYSSTEILVLAKYDEEGSLSSPFPREIGNQSMASKGSSPTPSNVVNCYVFDVSSTWTIVASYTTSPVAQLPLSTLLSATSPCSSRINYKPSSQCSSCPSSHSYLIGASQCPRRHNWQQSTKRSSSFAGCPAIYEENIVSGSNGTDAKDQTQGPKHAARCDDVTTKSRPRTTFLVVTLSPPTSYTEATMIWLRGLGVGGCLESMLGFFIPRHCWSGP